MHVRLDLAAADRAVYRKRLWFFNHALPPWAFPHALRAGEMQAGSRGERMLRSTVSRIAPPLRSQL